MSQVDDPLYENYRRQRTGKIVLITTPTVLLLALLSFVAQQYGWPGWIARAAYILGGVVAALGFMIMVYLVIMLNY